jgi:hypothetical protein
MNETRARIQSTRRRLPRTSVVLSMTAFVLGALVLPSSAARPTLRGPVTAAMLSVDPAVPVQACADDPSGLCCAGSLRI